MVIPPRFESPADFLLDLINTRVDESATETNVNDENTGDTVEDGGKTSESPSAIRDRSLVVKELAAAWITSERRTAYIEEGEAGARQTIKGSSDEQDPRRGRRNGITVWLRRFGALFSRTFLYKLREPSAVATQALNSIFVPLIVGSIYFQLPLTVSGAGDRLSGISLIVLLQSFMSFDQLLLFPKERGLYLHESNGNVFDICVLLGLDLWWSSGQLCYSLSFAQSSPMK